MSKLKDFKVVKIEPCYDLQEINYALRETWQTKELPIDMLLKEELLLPFSECVDNATFEDVDTSMDWFRKFVHSEVSYADYDDFETYDGWGDYIDEILQKGFVPLYINSLYNRNLVDEKYIDDVKFTTSTLSAKYYIRPFEPPVAYVLEGSEIVDFLNDLVAGNKYLRATVEFTYDGEKDTASFYFEKGEARSTDWENVFDCVTTLWDTTPEERAEFIHLFKEVTKQSVTNDE